MDRDVIDRNPDFVTRSPGALEADRLMRISTLSLSALLALSPLAVSAETEQPPSNPAVSAPLSTQAPEPAVRVGESKTTASESVTEEKPAVKAKPAPKAARKNVTMKHPAKYPSDYRGAKWQGGQGATWRLGANAYGFAGAFGGCVYRGSANPSGYQLEQIC